MFLPNDPKWITTFAVKFEKTCLLFVPIYTTYLKIFLIFLGFCLEQALSRLQATQNNFKREETQSLPTNKEGYAEFSLINI